MVTGDKIYTPSFIGTVNSSDGYIVSATFVSRSTGDTINQHFTESFVEERMSIGEWFVNHDPFN